MAFRVDLSSKARRDLQEISDFIQAGSASIAERWFRGLIEAIGTLREFPERGTPLHARPRYRQVLYGQKPNVYRILYRIVKTTQRVIVAHIRHGARDGDGL